MPPNTKYIGRGSKFGNPFRVVRMHNLMGSFWATQDTRGSLIEGIRSIRAHHTKIEAQKEAVDLFRAWSEYKDFAELAGHDLACWCKEGEPCHGDIILERLDNES